MFIQIHHFLPPSRTSSAIPVSAQSYSRLASPRKVSAPVLSDCRYRLLQSLHQTGWQWYWRSSRPVKRAKLSIYKIADDHRHRHRLSERASQSQDYCARHPCAAIRQDGFINRFPARCAQRIHRFTLLIQAPLSSHPG